MIEVVVVDTSADTDALSGTDLQTVPEDGLLLIFAASTVNTATISAGMGGRQVSRATALKLRTNGVPNVSDDGPVLQFGVNAGQRPVIDIGGTTGTVYTVARHFTLEEVEAGLAS